MADKQTIWDSITKQVDELADKLGRPIDPGIKDAVIGINAIGFKTTGSCEGHLDHGVAAPWLDIETGIDVKELSQKSIELYDQADKLMQEGKRDEATPLYKQARDLMDQANRPTWELTQKLTVLLEEFYKNRQVPLHQMLIPSKLGKDVRLQSFGAELQKLNLPEKQSENLKIYQSEMSDFANFLKQKYFAA